MSRPDSREISARVVIEGDLRLLTPTHLGNGDAEGLTDLPLLLDQAGDTPLPLLSGASIAGALRNYIRIREKGFDVPEGPDERDSLAVLLFGAVKGDTGRPEDEDDEGGPQSRLIVDDALGLVPIVAEVRDGVQIDARTRTAQEDLKYDLELLPAGTVFPLRFELLLPVEQAEVDRLSEGLALALSGLEAGSDGEAAAISIGTRKTRGFGRCAVVQWRVTTYQLRASNQDLVAWLALDHPGWGYAPSVEARVGRAAQALGVTPLEIGTHAMFRITATFALESPLLIRSQEPLTSGDQQPDFAHLRNGDGQPIISGTSLAGVLRARAQRILNTLRPSPQLTARMLNSMFGKDMQAERRNPNASRVIVEEARIEAGQPLVQNRVALDRFTGGALETALFAEAPHVGGSVELRFAVRAPKHDAEKGLLLLLLKDLWTSDLPIGGTSAIGRGRLKGVAATIEDDETRWTLEQHNGQLVIPTTARAMFEGYVAALKTVEEQIYA